MIFSYLNILRFIAALLVVFHHFGIKLNGLNEGILNQFIGNGNFMVNLFFVLSGFVLTHRYLEEKKTKNFAKKFYLRRAIRLLPHYYLSILLVLGFYLIISTPLDIPSLILSTLGIQSWNLTQISPINPPLWSLSVEFILYLLFPLTLIKTSNLSLKTLGIITTTFWILTEISIYFLRANYPSYNFGMFPLFSISSFIIGIYTYYIYLQNESKFEARKSNNLILIISIIIIVFLMTQHFLYKNYSGILAPLFAVLIYTLAKVSKQNGNKRTFTRLADLSFTTYVFHYPIYEIYNYILAYLELSAHQNTWASFSIYLLIVLISADVANKIQKKWFTPLLTQKSSSP